jgi:hypothetical protein
MIKIVLRGFRFDLLGSAKLADIGKATNMWQSCCSWTATESLSMETFSLSFHCVSGIMSLFLTSLVDASQQSMGARPPVLPRAFLFVRVNASQGVRGWSLRAAIPLKA